MSSNLTKVRLAIECPFYGGDSSVPVTITKGTSTNVWVALQYYSNCQILKNEPLNLTADNYYYTSKTGLIDGWVDYE